MNFTDVTYNKSFFALINHLSDVCADIPVEKHDERTIVKNKTKNNTIAYILDVSSEVFDFNVDGNKMAFQNFPEFYSMFGLMADDSSIKVNDTVDTLEIKDDSSDLSYNLGIRDAITSGFNGIPVDPANDIVMEIDNALVKKIKTVLGTLPGREVDKRINFKVAEDSNDLSVSVLSVAHANKWKGSENGVVVAKNGDMTSVDIRISSEVFKVLPELDDSVYQINLTICKNNFIKFSFTSIENDAFSLDVYTSKAVG